MKYLSLDLETTSLQPSPYHILMVSMVVEDTKQPQVPEKNLEHFTCFVDQYRIEGEAYALGMNGWILDFISGRAKNAPYPIYGWKNPKSVDWIVPAMAFLDEHFGKDKITVAGKNVAGFDIPFLPEDLQKRFRHKVLDPGTLYVDWLQDDQVPNFEICKRRAEMDGPVAHDAREDAMDVIQLLRRFY